MSFRRLRGHPEGGSSVTTSTASGSSMNFFPCSQGTSAMLRELSSPGPTKSQADLKKREKENL